MKVFIVTIGQNWEAPTRTMVFKTKELALEFIQKYYYSQYFYYDLNEYDLMETLEDALSILNDHELLENEEEEEGLERL